MSRSLFLTASALVSTLVGAIASAGVFSGSALAQASTIRIEPRPVYGATINVERGVRVWRPLPVTKYVIINPGNRTPLNLNLADVTENTTSHNNYYDHSDVGQGGDIYGNGFLGVPRFLPNRLNNRNRVNQHRHRGGMASAARGHGGGRR